MLDESAGARQKSRAADEDDQSSLDGETGQSESGRVAAVRSEVMDLPQIASDPGRERKEDYAWACASVSAHHEFIDMHRQELKGGQPIHGG
jgi:hypothetical protein